jgi:hypothetical protein
MPVGIVVVVIGGGGVGVVYFCDKISTVCMYLQCVT